MGNDQNKPKLIKDAYKQIGLLLKLMKGVKGLSNEVLSGRIHDELMDELQYFHIYINSLTDGGKELPHQVDQDE